MTGITDPVELAAIINLIAETRGKDKARKFVYSMEAGKKYKNIVDNVGKESREIIRNNVLRALGLGSTPALTELVDAIDQNDISTDKVAELIKALNKNKNNSGPTYNSCTFNGPVHGNVGTNDDYDCDPCLQKVDIILDPSSCDNFVTRDAINKLERGGRGRPRIAIPGYKGNTIVTKNHESRIPAIKYFLDGAQFECTRLVNLSCSITGTTIDGDYLVVDTPGSMIIVGCKNLLGHWTCYNDSNVVTATLKGKEVKLLAKATSEFTPKRLEDILKGYSHNTANRVSDEDNSHSLSWHDNDRHINVND